MYNILICDDEPDIVSALKIYLTGDEYQLFEAYNGRQALETVENYLKETADEIKVIFNVFKDEDLIIYKNILAP